VALPVKTQFQPQGGDRRIKLGLVLELDERLRYGLDRPASLFGVEPEIRKVGVRELEAGYGRGQHVANRPQIADRPKAAGEGVRLR